MIEPGQAQVTVRVNVAVWWQTWGEDESGLRGSPHLRDAAHIGLPVDRSRREPCPNDGSRPPRLNRKDGEMNVSIERHSQAETRRV